MPRAMFDVTKEERYNYGGARGFTLQAVIPQQGTPDADDPEVNDFWTATPQGQITITITNPDAYLEVGKRYYVDFKPAK